MCEYDVIGVMSGTSLDGVDLAYCRFVKNGNNWRYKIIRAETFCYSSEWKQRIHLLHESDASAFIKTHVEYGHLLGSMIKEFVESNNLKVDIVASHGHTIFHQPSEGFTFQIGDGSAISSYLEATVISDFRSKDVALGGQGAPLVPLGDKLLFSDYEFCLNLGGFANISFDKDSARVAFDICPVNYVLNDLCSEIGLDFDDRGKIACSGETDISLNNNLNSLDYYKLVPPKSIGREWVEDTVFPILNNYEISIPDKIRTCTEHMSLQIANSINQNKYLKESKVLITGGGAYNDFLISRIQEQLKDVQVVLPEKNVIEFKEAMIFAFLGVLRYRGENNCWKSVSGAIKDSSSGAIY